MWARGLPQTLYGVLPFFTTWVGPRTAEARLVGMTWLITNPSKNS